ncbi:MAG: Gfo/Idh/MocA family oxidoreductase [Chloroherpetonaceae bacterium]|nr:Gfo/Idh/MocA family oxidoreductase [Chthonomonadaceae bacterium]MDW8209397.1 Gfo/Idh/MocA family oxidoreductase [Chloroherpetonaceae bacterium]
MPEKKVRIGVIGTGGIANAAHLPGYAQIPDLCEIVALCDIDPKALEKTLQKYPVQHTFTDHRKMLEMDELDAVSICTPNDAHYQCTIDALNAGKHVLCEKPIALNARQAREMVETANRQGRILQVGYNSRFAPTNQALKRFIDHGELGEIYYARAQSLRIRGIPSWGVFIDRERQGGGPLIDIGVHILDLTLWFMGHPEPVLASGVTYQKFGTRGDVVGFMGQWDHTRFTVEDFASALIRFENGATIVLEASFVANIREEVHNTTLLGTQGGATTTPFSITQERHGSVFTYEPRVPNPNINTHYAEMKAFVECVRSGTPPLVTGEQGLMVARIMDAIYQSAELGREVPVAS